MGGGPSKGFVSFTFFVLSAIAILPQLRTVRHLRVDSLFVQLVRNIHLHVVFEERPT